MRIDTGRSRHSDAARIPNRKHDCGTSRRPWLIGNAGSRRHDTWRYCPVFTVSFITFAPAITAI